MMALQRIGKADFVQSKNKKRQSQVIHHPHHDSGIPQLIGKVFPARLNYGDFYTRRF
jgi:hypothetical protein